MARYQKGHKEKTHRHVVRVASERFRQDGIDSIGVAALMAEAGLTHGGFYAHFTSKEALVAEAVDGAFSSITKALAQAAEASPDAALQAIVETYLTARHRDRPATGCAAAAFAPDVARRSSEARTLFTDRLLVVIDLIASHLPPNLPENERRPRAWSVFALMMGALQLSRAVDAPLISTAILENAQRAALTLARAPAGASGAAPGMP